MARLERFRVGVRVGMYVVGIAFAAIPVRVAFERGELPRTTEAVLLGGGMVLAGAAWACQYGHPKAFNAWIFCVPGDARHERY